MLISVVRQQQRKHILLENVPLVKRQRHGAILAPVPSKETKKVLKRLYEVGKEFGMKCGEWQGVWSGEVGV